MDKKELEKLFRDELGDHRETPDPEVWNRIRSSLDEKKPARVLPIWWRWAAAAAVLAGILFLVDPWGGTELKPPAVTESGAGRDPGKKTSPAREQVPGPKEQEDALAGQGISEPQQQENPVDSGDMRAGMESRPATGSGEKAASGEAALAAARNEKTDPGGVPGDPDTLSLYKKAEGALTAESPPEDAPSEPVGPLPEIRPEERREVADSEVPEVPEVEKKSIFEAIEEQEALAQNTESGGKWTIGPSLAPVYFDSFGNGSPIDQNFVNNSKSGTVNMSYGLQVAYKVSRRLSIRSGIHRVDYGYNTEEIGFTSSPSAAPSSLIRSISYSENSRSLVVHSTARGAQQPQQPDALDISAPSPARLGSMVQEFGYLEVPVEMQYTLIDRKLGLHLIGGMSSLFLMDNSVSLESSGTTTEIGESNTMNSLNFSTNLGLGVFYRLSPLLELNLQPMFKYQLNTFSQTEGSFRPYSVGVYSGLSFRF